MRCSVCVCVCYVIYVATQENGRAKLVKKGKWEYCIEMVFLFWNGGTSIHNWPMPHPLISNKDGDF